MADDRRADRVRVRGIYATALTGLLLAEGYRIVQASPPIRERFEADLPTVEYDATVESTADRQGVGISGDPRVVSDVAALVGGLGRDAFVWSDDTPRSSLHDGVVREPLGSGAVVAIGANREGFLPYESFDGDVDVGARVRVQVSDSKPPWAGDRARLHGGLCVPGGIATLVEGRDGVVCAPTEDVARSMALLRTDVPDGWGVRLEAASSDASLDALAGAVSMAADRTTAFSTAFENGSDPEGGAGTPRVLATPEATTWCWFGRETRFALDEERRSAVSTMVGHHRIKAGADAASAAVDFVESFSEAFDVDSSDEFPSETFPFDAVTRNFGPDVGDRVAISHGKPDGRLVVLGRGEVTERDPDGGVTVRRELTGGGTYDALDVPREDGDAAITTFVEGRWWYPTVYRSHEGVRKGTYVNVGTPVEVFPREIRYVDLHVDVVKHADGTVERVDDDELDAAVEDGFVSTDAAEKARQVATSIERAL